MLIFKRISKLAAISIFTVFLFSALLISPAVQAQTPTPAPPPPTAPTTPILSASISVNPSSGNVPAMTNNSYTLTGKVENTGTSYSGQNCWEFGVNGGPIATNCWVVAGSGTGTFTFSGNTGGADPNTTYNFYLCANNKATCSSAVNVVVVKATPTITWSNPSAITYGTALSATQLNATANVAGTFTYTPASGVVLGVGAQTLRVTFAPNDTANYNSATRDVVITVNKKSLTVTADDKSKLQGSANPTLTASYSGFVNGDTFGSAVSGSPGLSTTATTNSAEGSYPITPTVGTLSSSNYSFNYVNGTLTVTAKSTPTITWSNPSAITYGTALGSAQLNATANVSGTFSYSPSSGSILGAGSHNLSVTFTPTDSTNYNTASKTVPLTVSTKSLTVIADDKSKIQGSSNPPLTVSYTGFVNGDTASSIGLNPSLSTSATTNSPVGTYTITVLAPSPTASGASNYNINYQNGTLTIAAKSTPTITWSNPSAITYGTALSATQLNATANVAGTFTYTPASGTILDAGSRTLSVTFTPNDTANYVSTSKTVTLGVSAKALTVTADDKTKVEGSANPAFTASYSGFVNGDSASSIGFTPNFSTSATTNSAAGNYTITALAPSPSPSAASNYNISYVNGVLTITAKALPTLTWSTNAGEITYGTPLSSSQLNATANIPGTFTYSPAADSVPNSGTQTLTVTFTPTDTANYSTVSKTSTLTVSPKPLTVTADDKTKMQGTANPPLTVSYTGFVNGDTASSIGLNPSLSTSATTNSPVGTYTITVLAPSPTPSSLSNYVINYVNGKLTVVKADPVITWPKPSSINYGTALSQTQLNATADVAGTFVYTPPAGIVLGSGIRVLSLEFTPNSPGYNSSTKSTTINVLKVPLAITADNKTKVQGSSNPALTASYGGFVNEESASSIGFTPILGTTATQSSPVGTYPITVMEPTPLPSPIANYVTDYISGIMNVTAKTIPVITWSDFSIIAGDPIPEATANVPGTFAYVTDSYEPGIRSITANFTPTDSTNYSGASKVVTMTVQTKNYTLTVAKTGNGNILSVPEGINYGPNSTASFPSGTSVVLTATPLEDSVFTSWTGCTSVDGDKCTVSMTSDKSVSATFSLIPPDYDLVATRQTTTSTTIPGVITLTWNRISTATAGYKVYRQTGGNETLWTTIAQPASGTTITVQNTGLVPGALYGYRVVAQVSSGSLQSSPVYFQFASEQSAPVVSYECAPGETELYKNSTPGTASWTVPTGITNAKVKVWGGGGAGGTGWRDEKDGENRGGAGGGGGGYAESTISVVTGSAYSIKVGNGGMGHRNILYPKNNFNYDGSEVFPAGNSEFIKDGTVLVGAGGGGGGGFAGLSQNKPGKKGADGKGKGGIVGGDGAGLAGLGTSSGGGIGATGGKGGSGYAGDIKMTGGTATETIDRGDNEDSTPGVMGANGGNGGLAGRCGREGKGHSCTTSSTLVSGYRVPSAQDGASPAGGGGGASTGWESGDIAGYGAHGMVLICKTAGQEEATPSVLKPTIAITCSESIGRNFCKTGAKYNLSGTVQNTSTENVGPVSSKYEYSTDSGANWSAPVWLPSAGTIQNLLAGKTQEVTAANNLPIGPVDGLTYRFRVKATSNNVSGESEYVTLVPASTLNITISGSGTVSENAGIINSCTSTCSNIFTTNSSLNLKAVANPGYTFTGWSQDCSASGNCALNMGNNHSVTATFTACDGGCVGGGGGSIRILRSIDDPDLLAGKNCYLQRPSSAQASVDCEATQGNLNAGTYKMSVDPVTGYSITWKITPGNREGVGVPATHTLAQNENAVITFTYTNDPFVTLRINGGGYNNEGKVASSKTPNMVTTVRVRKGRPFNLIAGPVPNFDSCSGSVDQYNNASWEKDFAGEAELNKLFSEGQEITQNIPLATYRIECFEGKDTRVFTSINVQTIDPIINEF